MDEAALIEQNRLRAKAKFQDRARLARLAGEATSASTKNQNGKRGPSNPLPAAAKRGTGQDTPPKHFQGGEDAPLPDMLGNYVDYDLSTLRNSRGGFLMDNEDDDPRAKREREQMARNAAQRLANANKQGILRDPTMGLDLSKHPTCEHCDSRDLDNVMRTVFGVKVCQKCKSERPDEYSLLTKTECKADYLLTDPELKDEELLPHLLKPNPHRPSYSNMMLFLRKQVEAFAFSDKKWGSPEALDAEYRRREDEKKALKSKKFSKKLAELRKKTRTNEWHKREERVHEHTFEEGRCVECGFEVETEEF